MAFMCATAYGGTATVSAVTKTTWGNKRVAMGTITITGAYGANGIACTAHSLGLNKVEGVIFMSSGTGDSWIPKWSGGYITLTVPYNSATSFRAATSAIAAGDSFKVHNKALAAADQETCDVYVTVVPGTSGSIAAIGGLTTVGGTTEGTALYSMFMAADSSTRMILGDTLDHPWVRILDGTLVNADTLYFDYNGSDRTARLMYSGTNLSNLGDLYVPYKNGKFIKIAKKTGATLYAAGAKPVYFVRAQTDYDEHKLWCDATGSIDNLNGFIADSTYTTLPRFRTNYAAPYASTESITAVYYYVAVGN